MKYDDIVEHIGEFGPYQRRVYFLACLPVFAAALQTLVPVFILDVPEYRCKVPGLTNDTYEAQSTHHELLINHTLLWTDSDPDNDKDIWGSAECHVLKNRNAENFDPTNPSDGSNKTVSCHEWVYDTSVFENTFATQENMVCDDEVLRSHANMIYMGGLLVGSLFFGLFSDAFGRKTAFMLAVLIHVVSGSTLAFSPGFVVFVILRFTTGIANMGIFMCCFVMAVELVGRKYRATAGVCIQFFWVVGMYVLDGIAYAVRDWKKLQLATSCYAVILLSIWWLVPESPRWQINKGKIHQASATLEKVARSNKTDMPLRAFDSKTTENNAPVGKLTDLFVSPVLAFRLFVVFVNWLVVTMVYYGLTLNVGSIGGNIYLNFFINTSAEGLANLATVFALPLLGRRNWHCFSMILGGVACLCSMIPVIIGETASWVPVLLSNLGKFGATGGFSTIYIFTAELFPTAQRNSIVGASSMIARLGGMISPYIADLGTIVTGPFGSSLPYIVFGSTALGAGLLALALPETLNRKLPETIQEAIDFGKNSEREYEKTVNGPQENGNVEKAAATNLEKSDTGIDNAAFESEKM